MARTSRIRRLLAACGALVALCTAGVVAAPSASADPDIPLDLQTQGNIHLAKLNRDVEGNGRFVGSVDFATGEIVGDLTFEGSEANLDLGPIRLATVGVAVVPTAPVTGRVDFSNFNVTLTAQFDINITYIRPFGSRLINLAGNRCSTKEPTTIEVTGVADPATLALSLEGEFEISKFENCLLSTPILDLLVSGGGNTFTSEAAPAAA